MGSKFAMTGAILIIFALIILILIHWSRETLPHYSSDGNNNSIISSATTFQFKSRNISNLEISTSSRNRRRIPGTGADDKLLLDAGRGRGFRDATNSTNSTNSTLPTGPDPEPDGEEVIDPEILKNGCVPVPKPPPPGQPPPPPQPPNPFPPCPIVGPTTIEPTPGIHYKGRLNFGENCITSLMITQITGTFEEKREQVEASTCALTKGLECLEVEAEGPPQCQCMAAFGQQTSERLEIGGKCFIPAGKGRFSQCFDNQQGLPLPTGDTKDPKEWNKVILPCVTNSRCQESSEWIGERCVCLKGFLLGNKDGTCNQAKGSAPALSIFAGVLLIDLCDMIY